MKLRTLEIPTPTILTTVKNPTGKSRERVNVSVVLCNVGLLLREISWLSLLWCFDTDTAQLLDFGPACKDDGRIDKLLI